MSAVPLEKRLVTQPTAASSPLNTVRWRSGDMCDGDFEITFRARGWRENDAIVISRVGLSTSIPNTPVSVPLQPVAIEDGASEPTFGASLAALATCDVASEALSQRNRDMRPNPLRLMRKPRSAPVELDSVGAVMNPGSRRGPALPSRDGTSGPKRSVQGPPLGGNGTAGRKAPSSATSPIRSKVVSPTVSPKLRSVVATSDVPPKDRFYAVRPTSELPRRSLPRVPLSSGPTKSGPTAPTADMRPSPSVTGPIRVAQIRVQEAPLPGPRRKTIVSPSLPRKTLAGPSQRQSVPIPWSPPKNLTLCGLNRCKPTIGRPCADSLLPLPLPEGGNSGPCTPRTPRTANPQAVKRVRFGSVSPVQRVSHVGPSLLSTIRKKPRMRPRNFKGKEPSNYCHLCGQKVTDLFHKICSNFELGKCLKVACKSCYSSVTRGKVDYDEQWCCPHCADPKQILCPDWSKCRARQMYNDKRRNRRMGHNA